MKKALIVVKTLSPLIVGGRNESPAFHRSSSLRREDEKDIPIIPASALKGALRDFARTWNLADDKTINELFGKEGGPENAGSVIFTDLKAENEENVWDDRVRIKIDRRTRTVESEHLVTLRAVRKDVWFEGEVIFKNDEALEKFKEIFIDSPVNDQIRIGGMKSIGFGRIKLELESARDIRRKKIKAGLNILTLKPITPFTTSDKGRSFGREYMMLSKKYINGSALRKALEDSGLNVKFASHLYPTTGKGVLSIPNPRFLFVEKYSNGKVKNLLREIFRRREEKRAFAMKIGNKRYEAAKGFWTIDGENANATPEYSVHVSIDPKTKTYKLGDGRGILFIQQSYSADYMTATVVLESDGEIPEYISLGGSRTRGFGLFRVSDIKHIDENEIKKQWKEKISDGKVAIVFRTHFYHENSQELFGAEILDTMVSYEDFHVYDPDEEKSIIIKAIAPGSVIVFKVDDEDSFVDRLYDLKVNGCGAFKEYGFGDFELMKI